MQKNLTKHYDYNEGSKSVTDERIESMIPKRFSFDQNRSNSIGGVNYVFSDHETEDVIRVSIRDRSLFAGSFYAKSESDGRSRARSLRDPEEFEPIATEIIEDVLE